DFNKEAVGTCGDGGPGHGRDFVAASRAVRRIGPHGQVRKLLDYWYRGKIERVARVGFKGADAALAENHVVVAAGKDVFGAEQELFHRRRHTAFEKNGFADFAECAQQVIVLHVARADLVNVHVLAHHFDLRRVHDFADGEQAELVGGLAHDL